MHKRELIEAINAAKEAVKSLVAKGKIAEAKEKKAELVSLQEQLDLIDDLDAEEVRSHAHPAAGGDAVAEFANAARRGFTNTMSEGTAANGGYTVPVDIETQIQQFKMAEVSLEDLVDTESVSTNTGARTFQVKAAATGFSLVNEGGAIGAHAEPTFTRLTYAIKKYAGYLPVTDELLEDSDAAITSVIARWLARADVATRNARILAILTAKTAVELSGLDGIKEALNVTLGSAYKNAAKIVTNDNGLQWLDTLKDNNGRYLLEPDPTAPAALRLRAGAATVPIRVVPNAQLPNVALENDAEGLPFIIGDFKESAILFDRKRMTIGRSTEASAGGVNAFINDMTLFRAILRLDCVQKDADSWVNGYVVPAAEEEEDPNL